VYASGGQDASGAGPTRACTRGRYCCERSTPYCKRTPGP